MIQKFLLEGRISFKSGTHNVFIRCPYHNDSTPSLGIATAENTRVPVGTWQCLGCGERGAWNKLATTLKLPLISQQELKDSTFLIDVPVAEGYRSISYFINEYGGGIGLKWRESENWRGIKGWLLRELGACRIYDQKSKQIRVLLPLSVNGSVKACIRAAVIKEESTPTYLNSDGQWGRKWGLFPFDYMVSMEAGFCCIVEGPRDALRLIQNGIPAVAILGSQNWGVMKRKLLSHCGKRLIILMDGDAAGDKAKQMLWDDFTENGVSVKVVDLSKVSKKLGKAVDPATLPKSYLTRLKEVG